MIARVSLPVFMILLLMLGSGRALADVYDEWAKCQRHIFDPNGAVPACSATLDAMGSQKFLIQGKSYSHAQVVGRVRAERARAYLRLGDDRNALADLDAALAVISDVSWIYLERSELLYRMGRHAEARRDAETAAERWPNNTHAKQLLARLGDGDSQERFVTGDATEPTPSARLQQSVGPDECRAGLSPDVTMKGCTALLKTANLPDQRRAGALWLRANAFSDSKLASQAAADLETYLKIRPKDPAALRLLAEMHQRLANRETAIKTYQQLAEVAPDDAAVERQIARLEAELNEELKSLVQDEARIARVRQGQTLLNDLGYDAGHPDGVVGPRTRAALAAWAEDSGRPRYTEINDDVLALLTRDLEQWQVAIGDHDQKRAGPKGQASVAREGFTAQVKESAPLPTPRTPRQSMLALVVGNGAYEFANPLPNPPNDARDMVVAFKNLGFEVIEGINLDSQDLRTVLDEFARKVPQYDIAVAYYAGHGVQVRGENYLLPIDAVLETERELRYYTPLDYVIQDTSQARQAGIVIVDACRDNPLAESLARSLGPSRSGAIGTGLAQPGQYLKTLVAYATQPGAVAYDGTGRNSPFTGALLKHIREPGLEVRQLFARVREDVSLATRTQVPPTFDSLGDGAVYLAPPADDLPINPEDLSEPEQIALRAALVRLGIAEAVNDTVDPNSLRFYITNYQYQNGIRPTGQLTGQEMVTLFKEARAHPVTLELPRVDFAALSDGLERSDPEMQALMGMIHDSAFEAAEPFAKDDALAVRWYRHAARAGDVAAAERMGLLLVAGGVNGSEATEAAEILRVAAEGGSAEAQIALAELYLAGHGVPSDEDAAVRLLRMAAQHPDGGVAIMHLRVLGLI